MGREQMRVLIQLFRREPNGKPWTFEREQRSYLEEQRRHDDAQPENPRRFPAKLIDFLFDAKVDEARKIIDTREIRTEREPYEFVHGEQRRGIGASKARVLRVVREVITVPGSSRVLALLLGPHVLSARTFLASSCIT